MDFPSCRIAFVPGLLAVLSLLACSPTATTQADGAADISVLPAGEAVDLAAEASPGKLTVFDFYADWCAPCRVLGPALEELARQHAGDLALRKIDVIDWRSAAVEHQGIEELPYLVVVDADGNVAAAGDSAFALLKERFDVDLLQELRSTMRL